MKRAILLVGVCVAVSGCNTAPTTKTSSLTGEQQISFD
jgi:hypothetical protein